MEVVNDCLDPFGGGNDEGTEVVEVAEVAESAILGVFDDDDMLINVPSQAADSSETPYNSGEMNVIVQGLQHAVQRREISLGASSATLFSAGGKNSHGMEFHVLQQFVNMDKEAQDTGFNGDGEICPF